MIPSRPTCVSWLLLASYAVLLVVAGVGVYASVCNFWEEEPLPPTPPPELAHTTTTTTTVAPNPYSYSRNDEVHVPEAYKEYVYASKFFARPESDSRLYVVVPCAVCVVVAALVLVVGLWSRQFFSFTFSLYNSVGMWALTLGWAIGYQTVVAWNSRMNLDFVCWVLAFHVILMLLFSAQILLSMWELRRQQAGWPTINWRSLFTLEAVLVTARLTLTVYTIAALTDSQMTRGFQSPRDPRYKNSDFYETPGIRYPLVLTLVCYGAACYNAVATMETVLSILLGKLHTHMTTVTSLLSGLCCVTIAVINSPVLMKMLVPAQYIYLETMYCAIALSVVTFLHVIACLGFSTTSRSPPIFFYTIVYYLVSAVSSLRNAKFSEQWLNSSPTKHRGNYYMIVNLISALFSGLSIIIVAAAIDSPMYRAWGCFLVICANSATLVRTLPAFVSDFVLKETDNTSSNQKLMAVSLECSALLVGVIAIFVRCYYGEEIFAGVINLLFLFFQIFVSLPLVKEKFKPKLSERTESLVGNEEISSEGNNDEQNPTEVLA